MHSKVEDKDSLNDVICGMMAASFAFGEFIGPLLGNFLNNRYGYHNCTYIVGFASICFSLLYALCAFERGPKRSNEIKFIPANRIRTDDVETEAT